MAIEHEGPFPDGPQPEKIEGALDGHDCPHCGIWFRLDDAKPAGINKVRCPNCDWVIEGA